jgi:hypothetical protein
VELHAFLNSALNGGHNVKDKVTEKCIFNRPERSFFPYDKSKTRKDETIRWSVEEWLVLRHDGLIGARMKVWL